MSKCCQVQVGGHLLGRLLAVAFAGAKALFLALAADALVVVVVVAGGLGPLGALGRRPRHVAWRAREAMIRWRVIGAG